MARRLRTRTTPILYLGMLVNISGAQAYAIDLSGFNTVVIWCKSFSVALAAAPLTSAVARAAGANDLRTHPMLKGIL